MICLVKKNSNFVKNIKYYLIKLDIYSMSYHN